MHELNCFSCKSSLADSTPACNDDNWTVACPACAVVNKLAPVADKDGHFTVSGAFFIVQKDPPQ